MYFIENYKDKPCDWDNISRHDNLEIDFIDKFAYNFLSWNWEGILYNTFNKYYEFKKDYENELQKLKNFKMIEEELIQKTWHPSRFQIWCWDEEQKKDNDCN